MIHLNLFFCILLVALNLGDANPIEAHRRHSNMLDEYEILAFIGRDPVVPVQLVLDISTSDVWFYDNNCKSCPVSKMSKLTTLKLPEDGDSFELNFTTLDNDKSGAVIGTIATDFMLLLPDIHFMNESVKHSFGLITEITGADETVDPYGNKQDGRIGLGLDNKSKTSTVDLLFNGYDKLLCLLQTGKESVDYTLTLGQKMLDDHINYNKITSSAVVDSNNGLWTIQLTGYVFGKYSASKKFRAQLSTTTSFVGVIPQLYSQIVQLLNAFESDDNLLVACSTRDKAPNLVLKVNGVNFNVTPAIYIVNGPDDSDCIVKIRKTDQDDYFVLGTPFLDLGSFCLRYDTKIVDFLNVTGFKE